VADPYYTLGIKRGCTRDEVIAAFRAKAWHAHPDRGGDEQSFIVLCAAYKQILKEPRKRRIESESADAVRASKQPPAQDPSQSISSPERDDGHRGSNLPDANWEPDLILAADVGRDGQPAPPPDPDWSPEFVLFDVAISNTRPPQPPDPDWEPEVILAAESTAHGAGDDSDSPPGAPEAYRSLFQRISVRAAGSNDDQWARSFFTAVGILFFLVLIAANIWLCWLAWSFDPEKAERQANSLPRAER
jgi:hypothetical protein